MSSRVKISDLIFSGYLLRKFVVFEAPFQGFWYWVIDSRVGGVQVVTSAGPVVAGVGMHCVDSV